MTGQAALEAFPATWRRVVTEPHAFYADMQTVGGLGEPTVFLALCALLNAAGHLLVGWGVHGAVYVFVGQVVGAFLVAAAMVLIAQNLFDGRAGFEPTFRVVAYASAPLVVAWLPLLGVLARLYTAYLILRGVERVQSLDTTRAVLTVLLGIATVWLIGSMRTGGPAWF